MGQCFCPFWAFVARCSTLGVALGWLIIAPSGRGRGGLRVDIFFPRGGGGLLPFQGVCCALFCPGRCPGLADYCPFGARAGWVEGRYIFPQRGWRVIAISGRCLEVLFIARAAKISDFCSPGVLESSLCGGFGGGWCGFYPKYSKRPNSLWTVTCGRSAASTRPTMRASTPKERLMSMMARAVASSV